MSPDIETLRKQPASHAALLLFGIFCASTATIFVKASNEFPLLVASYRLLIAALVLSPLFFRELKATSGSYGWKQVGWSALPALFMAINFSSFVIGARLTQASDAGLIIGLTPVVLPFYLWALNREKINRQEILATLFTLVGLAVLIGGNLHISRSNFQGDLICLGSMLALAGYMALGRKNAPRLSLWLYIVPLYFVAGSVCLLGAIFYIDPIKTYTPANLLLILALGLVSTALGQTVLNNSFKHFRGQIVSVASMAQPIFSAVLGFFFLGEVPHPVFYLAAVLMGIGIFAALYQGKEKSSSTAADSPELS